MVNRSPDAADYDNGLDNGGGNRIDGDLFGHRPVALEGRRREDLRKAGFDVKAGFPAGFENPAFLQFDKGLVNRGDAESGLLVQFRTSLKADDESMRVRKN